MLAARKRSKKALKSRIYLDSYLIDILRVASEIDKTTVSQVIEKMTRERPDFQKIAKLAQEVGKTVSKLAQIVDKAKASDQLVNKSIGQENQHEVPETTRDSVPFSATVFAGLLRHQGRAPVELEDVDLDALEEVYTLACSDPNGDAIFSEWLTKYIQETPDPHPRFLLSKVHRYAITK